VDLLTRRQVLTGGAGALGALARAQIPGAQAAPTTAGPVALMRGHGAVVVAGNLPEAVFRSVYTEVNARLQAQAMALGGPITYLDPEEAQQAQASLAGTIPRPWELWKRKALAAGSK